MVLIMSENTLTLVELKIYVNILADKSRCISFA